MRQMKDRVVFVDMRVRHSLLFAFHLFFFVLLYSPPSEAKTTLWVAPDITPVTQSSSYPFGISDAAWGPYMGFIYKDVPAFDIYSGDKISFDLGQQNDVDIQLQIDLVSTIGNGGIEESGAFTTIVSNTQVPEAPRGDTTSGNYELTFTAEAPFSFSGGGLIIRFSNAGGAFAADNTPDLTLAGVSSADTSGHFVTRFYNDADGVYGALWDSFDAVSMAGFHIGGRPNVLLIGAELGSTKLDDVRQKVLATGEVASADVYNAYSSTPSLNVLNSYESLLLWGNVSFLDAYTLGNNVANYLDAGGGVVTAYSAFRTGFEIEGRFNSGIYWAITPGSDATGDSQLGSINDPSHPVMKNVSTFDDGSGDSFRIGSTSVQSGAVILAEWSDGLPLVVKKFIGGSRRVDLNFYPPSSDVSGSWLPGTNGDLLLANALSYASGRAPYANNTSYSTTAGVPISGRLNAYMGDGYMLSFSITQNARKGTAIFTNSTTGDFIYSPYASADGPDTFLFKVNNGVEDSNSVGVTISMPGTYKGPSSPSGGCFIATAAYGTSLAPEIKVLRDFRDAYLLNNRPGKMLVNFYYNYSPPLADFIAPRPFCRKLVRSLLLPVVYGIKHPFLILALLASLSATLALGLKQKYSRLYKVA